MSKLSKVDRSELSRCLAKAAAYADCGKQVDAEDWARRLVMLLDCKGILCAPVHARTAEDRAWQIEEEGFDGGDGIG